MRRADDQPSVNVLVRADPIVHYTIKSTVNGHHGWAVVSMKDDWNEIFSFRK